MLPYLLLAAAPIPAATAPYPPATFEHTAIIAHLALDGHGHVLGCTMETAGRSVADAAPECDAIADPAFLKAVLGEDYRRAIAIDARLIGEAVGTLGPLPGSERRFDRRRMLGTADIEIGRDGHVRRCRPGQAIAIGGAPFNLCGAVNGEAQAFVADPAAPEPRLLKLSFELGMIAR